MSLAVKTIACVITCKGRLHHVQQTLPLIVAQGTSEVIVVDYGCPDRTGDWIEANFPSVTVLRVGDDPGFHLARARNFGAARATSDWLLFVDADILASDGWHTWMQDQLQPRNFYRRDFVEGIRDADTHGTVICARADFAAIGGYDEVYRGWGGEDEDLYQRLILSDVAEQTFPASFASAIRHGDEGRAGWWGLRSKQEAIDLITCYRLAKIKTLKALGLTGELPLEIRTHYMENTRRELMKWFADKRAYPLNLNYELDFQGRTVRFDINLAGLKGGDDYMSQPRPRSSFERLQCKHNSSEVEVVVLLSAWSSGSTSVAGYLDRCGAFTCPPYQMTNDPRTPNSFESLDFRNAMVAYTDELSLRVVGQSDDFVAWFERWLSVQKRKAQDAACQVIALKHPLAVNLIADIHRISACRFVLITRNLQAIEKTRQRRGWAPVYGEAGAKFIYSKAVSDLFNAALPSLSIPYERFLTDPSLRATLLHYCGLSPDRERQAAADSWLSLPE